MAVLLSEMLNDINTISISLNKNIFITEAKDTIRKDLDNVELSTEERGKIYALYVEQISVNVLGQAVDLAKSFPGLNAELDKSASEKLLVDAQTSKVVSEEFLVEAETLKVPSEKLLVDAQTSKVASEKFLVDAQTSKVASEELLVEAETLKVPSEKLLVEAQTLKVKNEADVAKGSVQQVLAGLHKQFGYSNATLDALNVSSDDGIMDMQISGFEKDMYYKIGTMVSNENQMLAQNNQAVQPWQVDVLKLAYEGMSQGKINLNDSSGTTVTTWNGDATAPNGLGV